MPYQLWITSTHDRGVPRTRTAATPFVSGPFLNGAELGRPSELWYFFNPHYEMMALARELGRQLAPDEGNDFALALPIVLAQTACEAAERLFKKHFKREFPSKQAPARRPTVAVEKATRAGASVDPDIDLLELSADLTHLRIMRNDIVHANYIHTYETGIGVRSRTGILLNREFVHRSLEAARVWIDLLQAWYLALKGERPQSVERPSLG